MDAPSALSADPRISIVVATYDRPMALRRCLDALRGQQVQGSIETIVVDNHPQSGMTSPLQEEYADVVWLAEPVAGLARARNLGIRAARGAVVVTTDDDVVAPLDWLDRLTAPLFQPAGPDATTGNCLPLKLETEAEKLFEAYGGLRHGNESRCFDRPWMDQWRVGMPHLWQIGTTANAAFRRAVLQEDDAGPFEVSLGAGTPAGAWEDLYFFYRMLLDGYRICYLPDAVLMHAHREDMDQLRKQLLAYRRGETAFLWLVFQRHRDWRAYGQALLWIPQWRLRVLLAELLRRLRGETLFPFRLLWAENRAYFAGPAPDGEVRAGPPRS